ncbi:MAG: hypothetical protein PHF56_24610 [Desulfuromonadaceae bacterium]|nr:hypothetical protein [Desulfuromonadaceae bacterium]
MSRISLSGIYDARATDEVGSSVCIVSLWKSGAAPSFRHTVHEMLGHILFLIDRIISKLLVQKDR